jgi:hypothetical protein
MKKMILTLAVAVSSMTAFAGSNPLVTRGEEDVTPKVLDAFKNEFATAKEVAWTVGDQYYKAAFTYDDKHVFAFYSAEGELIALTRNLSSDDLPLALLSSLKKNYNEYWISDLFEVAKPDDTSYFVTLENADTKIILKASGSSWSLHKKVKKA